MSDQRKHRFASAACAKPVKATTAAIPIISRIAISIRLGGKSRQSTREIVRFRLPGDAPRAVSHQIVGGAAITTDGFERTREGDRHQVPTATIGVDLGAFGPVCCSPAGVPDLVAFVLVPYRLSWIAELLARKTEIGS